MRGVFLALAAGILLAGAAPQALPPPRVLGYYPSWVAHPTPKEIRYERFTHLIHAFLQADANGAIKEDRAIQNPELTRLAHEKGVKVLLSIGGARSAESFREIVAKPAALEAFARRVATIVSENGYDGIDVDWEPTESEEDRRGLVALVRALRGVARGALLSAAAPASDWYGRWWDAETLRGALDFLNVMTYDFHGPWSGHAGHNAPLHGAPDDEEDGAQLSVAAGMAYWSATRKWPIERLNVGIPCYGRGFAVRRWQQKPSGKAPHEVVEANDIPALLEDGWRRAWDAKVGVPTLLKEGFAELISYEDAESAALKGAWAREKGYRGIFFWTIAQDWREGDHAVVKAAAATFRK